MRKPMFVDVESDLEELESAKFSMSKNSRSKNLPKMFENMSMRKKTPKRSGENFYGSDDEEDENEEFLFSSRKANRGTLENFNFTQVVKEGDEDKYLPPILKIDLENVDKI
jgi:hypothetical protein